MSKIARIFFTYTSLLFLCFTATQVNATLIYDNGTGFTSSGQSDLDSSIAADDFVLTSPNTTIRSVHWRGEEKGIWPGVDQFTVQIYSDNAGPDALLHSFAITALNRSDAGLPDAVYNYSANITPTTLSSGQTYWLSIFNDTRSNNAYNWEWTHGVGNRNGFRSFDQGLSWTGPENVRSSFQLDDQSVQVVPVPAAVWLMGSALVGLIGFRRKQAVA